MSELARHGVSKHYRFEFFRKVKRWALTSARRAGRTDRKTEWITMWLLKYRIAYNVEILENNLIESFFFILNSEALSCVKVADRGRCYNYRSLSLCESTPLISSHLSLFHHISHSFITSLSLSLSLPSGIHLHAFHWVDLQQIAMCCLVWRNGWNACPSWLTRSLSPEIFPHRLCSSASPENVF